MNVADNNKISSFLEAVDQNLDATELKSRLNQCSTVSTACWKDEHSLDLVHHCILHSNVAALLLLFNKGHFKPPYEPVTWPYLHFVACLGYRSIISTIVQELRYQNNEVLLDWHVYDTVIKPKLKKVFPDLENEFREEKCTPIDVAAIFGHTASVQLLLDFWQVSRQYRDNKFSGSKTRSNGSSLYLTLASQSNSMRALQLLLKEHNDRKEALEFSVRMSLPPCVDVILHEKGPDFAKTAFHGMNLFHVLYSYNLNRCVHPEKYKFISEITEILIKHNVDVNGLQVSRTFPLYSLLCHATWDNLSEEISNCLLSCLILLLEAGADPNIDEVLLEEKMKILEHKTAYGRQPYSSAVNCILCRFCISPKDKSITQPFVTYVLKCLELLMKHGADLTHIGKFSGLGFEMNYESDDMCNYGTALHVLVSTRAWWPDISTPILRLLLHNGVDVDVRGCWLMKWEYDTVFHYALNILPFSLWLMSLVHQEDEIYTFKADDFKKFTFIMKFMSQSAVVQAYEEFINGVDFLRKEAKEHGKLHFAEQSLFDKNELFGKIISAYEKATREPWSLQRCCSHTAWRACRMLVKNIFDLPIPEPLKNVIMHFH